MNNERYLKTCVLAGKLEFWTQHRIGDYVKWMIGVVTVTVSWAGLLILWSMFKPVIEARSESVLEN